MRRSLFFIAAMLFATNFARGQDAAATDQAEQIKALLARVELLEKQVAELKATRVASVGQAAPPARWLGSVGPVEEVIAFVSGSRATLPLGIS